MKPLPKSSFGRPPAPTLRVPPVCSRLVHALSLSLEKTSIDQTRSRQDDNKIFDNEHFSFPLGLIGSVHEGVFCFEKASVLPPTYIATKATWSEGIARLAGTIRRYLVILG